MMVFYSTQRIEISHRGPEQVLYVGNRLMGSVLNAPKPEVGKSLEIDYQFQGKDGKWERGKLLTGMIQEVEEC